MVHDAAGCVVTPGMVNAHQHFTGDPLVRSCIPDLLPPGASIFQWSVPLHGEHTGDDDETSATLCAVESLRNGVTTVIEAGTVAHPERVAAGMVAAGIRGTIGTWGWDIEVGPFTAPCDEVLDRQRAVVERFPAGGQVEGWVTLVGHDLASDELLAGASNLARDLGTSMTMHLSPTSSDPERYLERTGKRPVVHLDALGALGPHLLLAHGVWFDDAEIELVLSSGTAIAYCPWAYLRLGQGVTRMGRPRRDRRARRPGGARLRRVERRRRQRHPPRCGRARCRHRSRRPHRPRAVRRPPGVRARDDRRRPRGRDGGADRLARARQAGRHRGAPGAADGDGRPAATWACSSCGAPTAARVRDVWVAGTPGDPPTATARSGRRRSPLRRSGHRSPGIAPRAHGNRPSPTSGPTIDAR